MPKALTAVTRWRRKLAVVVGIAFVLLLVTDGSTPPAADPGSTTRVSVDSAGNQGNDESLYLSISADGRYVAFHSDGSNLVGETPTVWKMSSSTTRGLGLI